MPVTVTAATLRAAGACKSQIALFERKWPEGLILPAPSDEEGIAALAPRVVALGRDFQWIAARLLSPSERVEYDRATSVARDEYARTTSVARDEYDRTTWRPAWIEYSLTCVAAAEAYHRVIVAALIRLLATRGTG